MYILEESNFNFRYARLGDLHVPREKWLNYLHTVETSDLGLHCFPIILLRVDYNGLKMLDEWKTVEIYFYSPRKKIFLVAIHFGKWFRGEKEEEI